MTYWYFSFEGKFKKPEPKYGCDGVCSSCLLPCSEYQESVLLFHNALDFKGIELREILEEFEVNFDDLDTKNDDHKEWIELFEFTKQQGVVVFNEMNVFEIE